MRESIRRKRDRQARAGLIQMLSEKGDHAFIPVLRWFVRESDLSISRTAVLIGISPDALTDQHIHHDQGPVNPAVWPNRAVDDQILLENITAIPSSERFEYVAVSDHQSGSQHYVPHIVQVLGDNLHETASAKPARQLSLARRVFFVDQRALPLTESRRAPSIGRTRRYSASSSRSQPSRG
jgi:hypothetical protein